MKSTLLAATVCLSLAACASSPKTAAQVPLQQPTGWKAVLIAGDDAEPAFDNAVDAMARKLARDGVAVPNVTVLKATGQGQQAASKRNVVNAFANLDPAAGDGCFVFVTSHGAKDRGLIVKSANAMLTPADLDGFLGRPCEGKPTVVIASGCFSGSFAEGPMPAANRVILTAARDDRTSFGCDAKRKYTVFDECILGSIERGLDWQAVMSKARACVSSNEQMLGVVPSTPQISVGADVANLLVF